VRQQIYVEGLREWIESSADGTRAAAALAHLRRLVAGLERQTPDLMPRDLLTSLDRANTNATSRTTAAEAHGAFLEAQRAMDRDEFTAAEDAFARARPELARMRSPLLLTARYHEAVITYRRRAMAEALSQLTSLAVDVRPRTYPALTGRIEWMLGLVHGVLGHPRASDEHYAAAIEAFEAAGEPANAASVGNLLAVNLERAGDPWTAWSFRRDALARSPRPGVLLSAALGAANRGWPRAALVFTDAALTAARASESAPNIADVLRIEASIRADLDGPAAMAPLIDEARRLVSSRHEPAWERVRAEIALAVAQSAPDERLAEGLQAADDAIAHFRTTAGAGRLPQLYAIRAGLYRRAGRMAEAEQDVRAGLEALSVQRRNLQPGASQATFETIEHDLLDELVALARSSEAADAAFALVDASRGRDVLEGEGAPLALRDFGAALPDRTALVSFFVADHSTYAWTVTNKASGFERMAIDRPALEALVRAITPPRDEQKAAAELARLLLARLAPSMTAIDTLVIVPDGPLRAVPFARLPTADGLPLVTSAAIVVAPSVATWIQARQHTSRARSPHAPVLVVGNPAFDPHEYPTLRGLPQADAEAAAVAGRYTGAPLVLRGADATRAALLRELPRARVMHFAGHAISDPWTADASFLALAGPRPSRLTAADVRQLDLAETELVVLAACETASSGGGRRLDSPLSLARAFLAAGVPQVVGSLWLASDHASRVLFDVFHAEYARSGDAPRALQHAQQMLAASPDPELRAPRHWAGFVVMGG
jgi:CHAT domain-containing protein